jgi:hypothetical protein
MGQTQPAIDGSNESEQQKSYLHEISLSIFLNRLSSIFIS